MKGHRWDRRTREYRAIAGRERKLCRALGAAATPQRRALAHEIAVLEVVLLPPLDVHLSGAQIVNRRGKTAPALALRLKLSTRLQELLQAVGLDRVKRTPPAPWQRRPRSKADKAVVGDQGGKDATTGPGEGPGEGKEIVEGRESPVGELLCVTPETGE